jgi:hypothetical protein
MNFEPKTQIIDADLSKVVDRIIKQYEIFPKAFQKEALQNAWDARMDKKEAKGWKVKIYTFKESRQTHLIIEDFGTTGMDEKKWKAFLSLWKPEKERADAGGQGQGKFVLMKASKEHILIVESKSDEIPYRCMFLKDEKRSINNQNYTIKDFIPNASLLDHKGTRVWIYNVDEKFLKTIYAKEFMELIQESWWQVLGPRFNGEIYLLNKKIKLPPIPSPKEEVTLLENKEIPNYGRIKRLVLSFYDTPIPEIFQGVRVQRANMMITKIPFEVEEEYKNRLSGFIEFDKDLEISLKDIERTDHCGFLYESPWKEIKNLIKRECEKFVNHIIPKREKKTTFTLKSLDQVIQKANQIIYEHCPEILKTASGSYVPSISVKPKLPLRIKYLTINKKEVKWGDTITPRCGIINGFNDVKKILLKTELKKEGTRISKGEYRLRLSPKEQKSIKLSEINLDKENYPKGKYTLRVTIEENRHDIDSKATSFYLEIKREPIKKGFIKDVKFLEWGEPVRNKPINNGVIHVNLAHKDFMNLWESFHFKKRELNTQMGFYVIKICLDEAINELLKIKLKEAQQVDLDDLVKYISNLRDKMYYDVYT